MAMNDESREDAPPTPFSHHGWQGRDDPCLDRVAVQARDRMVIGCYGGSTSAGAHDNEDAALLWADRAGRWEFGVIVDAHDSSDSAVYLLDAIGGEERFIQELLDQPSSTSPRALEARLVSRFSSDDVRAACRGLNGEASMLLTARKDDLVWWLNVGDCLLYLLHPDLAAFGQFTLNQRNYYEWIGRINSFDLPVPCYSSGVRQLRSGPSIICLATDGLVQGGASALSGSDFFYNQLFPEGVNGVSSLAARVESVLQRLHHLQSRDSATVICWACHNRSIASGPSS